MQTQAATAEATAEARADGTSEGLGRGPARDSARDSAREPGSHPNAARSLPKAASRARAWIGLASVGALMLTSAQACVAFRTFDVVTTSQSTIEGSDLLGDLFTVTFPDLATIDLSNTSEFQNQGVAKEDIDSVKLSNFTLKVVSPDTQDLAFFDALSFFVEADGLDRVRIAHYEDFQAGQREINLVLDDVELRDYVASDNMSVTTEVTARQPPDDTVLDASLVFTVVASQQAACQLLHDVLP